MLGRLLSMILFAVTVAACGKSNGGGSPPPPPPPPPPPAGMSTGPATCLGGMADDFTCSGIDLRARVPNADMGGGDGNDIWGWVDSQSGREYALVGLSTGTAFVDVTDPEMPAILGRLPTRTVESAWRDVKVYGDFAFVVADNAGAHGMQVFDLTRLRNVAAPQLFTADANYDGFTNAHNIAINDSKSQLYALGTNTCGGGLHIVDIANPLSPVQVGCHSAAYTHDAQCLNYQGPDADHLGEDICVNSNGNSGAIAVVDVTNPAMTSTISTTPYPQAGYTHQGWLTEDQRFFLLGDELDEIDFGVPTRTLIFDLADLDAPQFVSAWESTTTSIDHNLYVLGNLVYRANYTTGVRILEFQDLSMSQITEIAFFDTFPDNDATVFDGVWSVYPYFPSGNIIASDISNGLFVLTRQ